PEMVSAANNAQVIARHSTRPIDALRNFIGLLECSILKNGTTRANAVRFAPSATSDKISVTANATADPPVFVRCGLTTAFFRFARTDGFDERCREIRDRGGGAR